VALFRHRSPPASPRLRLGEQSLGFDQLRRLGLGASRFPRARTARRRRFGPARLGGWRFGFLEGLIRAARGSRVGGDLRFWGLIRACAGFHFFALIRCGPKSGSCLKTGSTSIRGLRRLSYAAFNACAWVSSEMARPSRARFRDHDQPSPRARRSRTSARSISRNLRSATPAASSRIRSSLGAAFVRGTSPPPGRSARSRPRSSGSAAGR
jgi:hypothetical protein